MNRLQWFFELVDRASAPAEQVERSLSRLEGRLLSLRRISAQAPVVLSRGFRLAQGAIASGVGALRAALRTLTSLPALITVGAVGLTGKFVLDAIAFRENAERGLEVVLGTRQAAEDLMQRALRFARITPFEPRPIMELFTRLAMFGFKADEVERLAAALGDVAALRGFDPDVFRLGALAISQVVASGRLMGQELIQLANLGVSKAAIYQELARVYGTTTDRIRQMQEQGLIPARVALFAIVEAIRRTVSGGAAVGSLMQRLSTTLSGLWSTVRGRPFEFLVLSIDPNRNRAVARIREFLQNLVQLTDPDSPTGRRLLQATGRLVTAVLNLLFGPLAGATAGEKARALVDRIAELIERAAAWIETQGPRFVAGLLAIASAFWIVTRAVQLLIQAFSVLGRIVGAVLRMIGLVVRAVRWLVQAILWLGRVGGAVLRAVARVAAPVTRASLVAPQPLAAGAAVGGALAGAARQHPDVLTWLRTLPLTLSLGVAHQAMARLRGPRAERQQGAQVSVSITAPITVNDAYDERRVAQTIHSQLTRTLNEIAESIAAQIGATPPPAFGRRVVR